MQTVLGIDCAKAKFDAALKQQIRDHIDGHPGLREQARLLETIPGVGKALFFPAIVAVRYNPLVRAFAQRLAQAGKARMAIVGAAMRKLVHIIFGVLKSGRPFDPTMHAPCA